jgi:hypothetical protein
MSSSDAVRQSRDSGELEPPRHPCSWKECGAAAAGTVHAQWSVVDFDDYPACDGHIHLVAGVLWRRLVDGREPVDVWIERWMD